MHTERSKLANTTPGRLCAGEMDRSGRPLRSFLLRRAAQAHSGWWQGSPGQRAGSRTSMDAPHDYASGATPCRRANTNVVYKTPPNVPAVNRNGPISLLKNPVQPFCGKSSGSTPGSVCIFPGINKGPTACLIPRQHAAAHRTQAQTRWTAEPAAPGHPGIGPGDRRLCYAEGRCISSYHKMQFAALDFRLPPREAGLLRCPAPWQTGQNTV